MSYLTGGNVSDNEQDKSVPEYRLNRSNNNLSGKPVSQTNIWRKNDDSESEISDSGNFLAKGKVACFSSNWLSFLLIWAICVKHKCVDGIKINF